MPISPLKPCAFCKVNLTRERYCDTCKPLALAKEEARLRRNRKTADIWRGSATERGYNNQWQKIRKVKIGLNPLCELCERKGRVVPAAVVHHIQPVDDMPLLRLEINNLMSLCRECHERIHGRAKRRIEAE